MQSASDPASGALLPGSVPTGIRACLKGVTRHAGTAMSKRTGERDVVLRMLAATAAPVS